MLVAPGNASLQRASKSVTFDGSAALGQAGTNVPVFTVTGEVLIVAIMGHCETNLGEAAPTATLSLGVTGAETLFIGATTATDIDAGEIWVDTAPDALGVALPAACKDIIVDTDIVMAPATQNVNSGRVVIECWWMPLSDDGDVS